MVYIDDNGLLIFVVIWNGIIRKRNWFKNEEMVLIFKGKFFFLLNFFLIGSF